MSIERIEKHIDLQFLKEDFRKLGVNFITAGIVGVFVNHFVGYKMSTMLWTAVWVTSVGIGFLTAGLYKLKGRGKKR